MDQLQYHIRMMQHWLTAWLKVTQKACFFTIRTPLTIWPRVNQVDQHWPHGWWAPSWQWCTYSTKAKLTNNEEPPPMEVLEICITAKWTSYPVPLLFCLAYASAFTSSHVCTWSLWGIQCENTLLEPPQICPTHMVSGIAGDTIHANSLVDFWMGGVDQRIFGLNTAAPLKKPKRQLPIEVLWVPGQYNPEDGVHGRIIKKHLQSLTQCFIGCKLHHDLITQSNIMIALNI